MSKILPNPTRFLKTIFFVIDLLVLNILVPDLVIYFCFFTLVERTSVLNIFYKTKKNMLFRTMLLYITKNCIASHLRKYFISCDEIKKISVAI